MFQLLIQLGFYFQELNNSTFMMAVIVSMMRLCEKTVVLIFSFSLSVTSCLFAFYVRCYKLSQVFLNYASAAAGFCSLVGCLGSNFMKRSHLKFKSCTVSSAKTGDKKEGKSSILDLTVIRLCQNIRGGIPCHL